MTWKHRLAVALFAVAVSAGAQDTTPPVVQWKLEVIRDGQQIDSFDGTTTVGQARTDTHHQDVLRDVGCLNHPGGDIDLQRTLTVSPIAASGTEVTLAIEARETLEESDPQQTPEGCQLPPQPRLVTASHPGLRVPTDEWVTWKIVDRNPSLAYRVHASIEPPQSR